MRYRIREYESQRQQAQKMATGTVKWPIVTPKEFVDEINR
jgi:hypothetical protein